MLNEEAIEEDFNVMKEREVRAQNDPGIQKTVPRSSASSNISGTFTNSVAEKNLTELLDEYRKCHNRKQ